MKNRRKIITKKYMARADITPRVCMICDYCRLCQQSKCKRETRNFRGVVLSVFTIILLSVGDTWLSSLNTKRLSSAGEETVFIGPRRVAVVDLGKNHQQLGKSHPQQRGISHHHDQEASTAKNSPEMSSIWCVICMLCSWRDNRNTLK